jgi:hypothetical protein
MGMGHDSRTVCVFDRGIQVIRKIGPDGCYAHGRAVAEGPLAAKEVTRRGSPCGGVPQLRE